jgi:hypothetical protein
MIDGGASLSSREHVPENSDEQESGFYPAIKA